MTLKAREAYWRRTHQRRERAVEKQRAETMRLQKAYRDKKATHQRVDAAKRQLREDRAALQVAAKALAAIRAQITATQTPLRLRALKEAQALVGVMEQGGNNMGAMVSQIIRSNGGPGPEPWCGDFVAWCYRKAGSKMVTRGWAAVAILGWLTGMKVVSQPVPGAIAIFSFSHTGLVEKVVNGSTIQTIEGNTGASGAVSDSKTGGDGVYRKRRARSLVVRYVIPTR